MLIDLSYKAIAEALLFVAESPMSVTDLAQAMDIDESGVREVMALLLEEYATNERGIILREIGGGYQLMTAPIADAYIEKVFAERKTKLSAAAYETLSIIAYKQPVTRSQIEYIRGVKSEGPIGQLMQRGLIEEKGRLEQPGRPVVFGTTTTFLVAFGLNSLEELPRYQECKEFNFEIKDALLDSAQ